MLFCHLEAKYCSSNGYFAASAKIDLILTQTLILTLFPTLILAQTEEKHYFACRGKIAIS